jgi:hypothetical protein
MKWCTPVSVAHWQEPMNYQGHFVALGSCFADTMGNRLLAHRLNGLVNPFGVLFSPTALASILERCANDHFFERSELWEHQGLFHHPEAHSSCSGTHAEQVVLALNDRLSQLKNTLTSSASHALITIGTAWVYREITTQKRVANCHKKPQHEFRKELLSVKEVADSIRQIQSSLRQLNPHIKIAWTVSPVRHTKDGLIENQRSKSHLIAGLHQVLDESAQADYYFPAYEILLDELRDYRFFADDLIHPGTQAIEHIWNQWVAHAIDAESVKILEKINGLHVRLKHRPLFEDSLTYQQFKENLQIELKEFKNRYPTLNWTDLY